MKQKTRVCLIAPNENTIGGIAQWKKLITSFEQDDVDFFNINQNPNIQASQVSKLKYLFHSFLHVRKIKKQLKYAIQNQQIDVVHLTTSGGLGLIRDKKIIRICNKNNIPVIYHLHFGRVAEIKEKDTREWKKLYRLFQKVSKIICIDPNTEKNLLSTEIASKTLFIPNPVENYQCNYSLNSRTILFVGWVVKTKGIEELVAAWNELYKKYPDWKVKIIGPYKEDYMRKIVKMNRSNSLEIVGPVDHEIIIEEMSKSGLFILPSYTEGFPNVILEAMSCGLPIIATDVGAIKLMLNDNCGYVLPVKDLNKLSQIINKIILDTDLRESMSKNSFSRVQRKYSVSVVFNLLKDIW